MVYDSECIWSLAYERLRAYGDEESMLTDPVVTKDHALAGTSAWANLFLGRDHHRPEGSVAPAPTSIPAPVLREDGTR